MGLNFNQLYKGGSLPAAAGTQSNNLKPLTPQNINILRELGLKPIINNGRYRYWC